MEDKIIKIEFNVWANDEAEGEMLKKAVCDFIAWHGQQGRKVTAKKLADAINNWQNNLFVRNQIINYFK